MANERKTESFVEEILRNYEYVNIHYQGSEDKNVQSLLKSKGGNRSGKGKPEFTIKLNGISSDLLIIECKKEKIHHESEFANKVEFLDSDLEHLDAQKYAVDGVIHYMASVKSDYNVVGVAVSGTEKDSLEISTFVTKDGKIIRTKNKELLSSSDYLRLLKQFDYQINDDIIRKNIQKELPILHNELRDMMKLSEQEKPILISACLLALKDEGFKNSFKHKKIPQSLADHTYSTIESTLKEQEIPEDKIHMMMGTFLFIKNNKNVINNLKYVLEKVSFLFDNFNFHSTSYDVIGDFYNEFLKYTGGDKQGLGIVLTPKHISDIFCQLGNITKDSVVLDTCTGTGSFLISAMKYMIELANGNSKKIEEIKKNQLIGIEQNPLMFTLACSNMILRNDGKSNMFNGSCFDLNIHEKIKQLKPTVCLINPPYSQKDKKESELAFIKTALDLLEKNGKLVAIVPISSAIDMSNDRKEQRKELLKDHTLDAVFSMADELFYPVGVVTCIMVFTAKVPHGILSTEQVIDSKTKKTKEIEIIKPNKNTYFGFWKDDGFVKTKTNGRCDKNNKWEEIRKQWLFNYVNGNAIDGHSAKVLVNENDEWCCEAYMNIDYNAITEEDFVIELKKLLAFELINGTMNNDDGINEELDNG